MLGLYLRTAKYYKLSQIVGRLRMGLDRSLSQKFPSLTQRRYAVPAIVSRDHGARFFIEAELDCSNELAPLRKNVARLEKGVFRLLNKEIILGAPVNWDPPGSTRLWRYNLHYFDFALDLALVAKCDKYERATELLRRLFHEWIEANPVGKGVPWHSYPLARRIANWIQSVSLVSPEALFQGGDAEAAWLRSLYQQTRFLEDHLEFDLQGNHLLADARALVFAGIFFGGKAGDRWHKTGLNLLWNGLREQFLPDGGHYERSPMYHASMLQDYLEVVLLQKLNNREVPAWVREHLISMADYLSGILHPDGEIPLFSDCAFGVTHSTGDILAAAERLLGVPGRWEVATPGLYCAMIAPRTLANESSTTPPKEIRTSWPDTGYVALSGSTPGDKLIVDAMPMGPDHLPAHGHCSLFSYELSIAGKRLIVDSGVEEYETGPWRDFWRSTRAHNTVVVDGCEQSEIWAAFRVGSRIRLLQSTSVQQNSASLFVGEHGGFVGQSNPTNHRRYIASLSGGLWIVLDEIIGKGRHTIESLVHLAPDAGTLVEESAVNVSLGSVHVRFHPYRSAASTPSRLTCVRGEANPIQGWYAPEFGKREANSVLSFSAESSLPARVGYLIAPADREILSWNVEASSQAKQMNISVQSPQGDLAVQFNL